MIVCSCLYISTNEYPTYKELVKRLKAYDTQCASCLTKDSLKLAEEIYKRTPLKNDENG